MTAELASLYRHPLTIDHNRVFNTDQRDFPLLVRLCDSTLRSTASGGHVAHSHGADLFFTQADGRTRLPHELVAYDPEQGQLEAWVQVPVLSCRQDEVLYLYYGGSVVAATAPARGRLGGLVWSGATRGAEGGRLKRDGVGRRADRGGVGAGDGDRGPRFCNPWCPSGRCGNPSMPSVPTTPDRPTA